MLSGHVFAEATKCPQSNPTLGDWGRNLVAELSTQSPGVSEVQWGDGAVLHYNLDVRKSTFLQILWKASFSPSQSLLAYSPLGPQTL